MNRPLAATNVFMESAVYLEGPAQAPLSPLPPCKPPCSQQTSAALLHPDLQNCCMVAENQKIQPGALPEAVMVRAGVTIDPQVGIAWPPASLPLLSASGSSISEALLYPTLHALPVKMPASSSQAEMLQQLNMRSQSACGFLAKRIYTSYRIS